MYKFNPEEYGFDHQSNFPELQGSDGPNSFIKVIAVHSGDNNAFWYVAANKVVHGCDRDDRWKITSGSWCTRRGRSKTRTAYCGIIPNGLYAKMLLSALMAACSNDSIQIGGERFADRSLNSNRLR